MKKNIYVSVSTDPIKNSKEIIDYAKEMQNKADMLHCDIMDGEFVEKTTYGASFVKTLNLNTTLMLDVHLMVANPATQINDYIKAGANIVTVHYEAIEDKEKLSNILKEIRAKNALAGISIKPKTAFKDIKMFLYNVDLVLVMSVEPGLSGQKFMPEILDKVKELDRFRNENNLNFKIEIDGGVNNLNAKQIVEAGADILVSGSYVYNSENRKEAIDSLKS